MVRGTRLGQSDPDCDQIMYAVILQLTCQVGTYCTYEFCIEEYLLLQSFYNKEPSNSVTCIHKYYFNSYC